MFIFDLIAPDKAHRSHFLAGYRFFFKYLVPIALLVTLILISIYD